MNAEMINCEGRKVTTDFTTSTVRILKQHAANPARSMDFVRLRELGREYSGAMEDLKRKYLDLCAYIREKQFTPDEVQTELGAVGLPASRISEIKAVCFTSKEIWKEYEERLIGFKAAVEKARARKSDAEEKSVRKLNRLAVALERVARSVKGGHVCAWGHKENKQFGLVLPPVSAWKNGEVSIEGRGVRVTATLAKAKKS